jgi:hypothetical protein
MKKIFDTKADKELLEMEAHKLYGKYSESFKKLLKEMEMEKKETKVAFLLLHAHAFEGRELTHEEKEIIVTEMKDLLKTVGLVGITVMPGGTIVFILAKFLKLSNYILPSAFLEPEKGKP